MKTYLLINKQSGKIEPYKTLSALLADKSKEQLGVSESTLYKHIWDASTNWKYENDKIKIKESYAKGMAEVILGKLAVQLFENGYDTTVRASKEVEANGFYFIYKKGLMLKDKSKSFESIQEVLSFLK